MIAQWSLILTPSSWGKSLPPPAALVYWTSERSIADLGGVELVVARNRHQRIVGEELGDEPAKGGVERRAAAGGVGEERAAAGLEMPAQGLQVLLAEGQRRPAVDVDQRVVDKVRVAGKELLVVDHDVEAKRRLAEGVHQVGDGQGRDVPVAGVPELGDPQGASLGGIGLEVAHLADGRACRPASPGRSRSRSRSGRPWSP